MYKKSKNSSIIISEGVSKRCNRCNKEITMEMEQEIFYIWQLGKSEKHYCNICVQSILSADQYDGLVKEDGD